MRVPLGYQQYTLATTAASTLTPIPSGARYVWLQAETQGVRWLDGPKTGTPATFPQPTTATGFLLPAQATPANDNYLEYSGPLSQLRFVGVATGALLNVQFYR